MKGETFKSERGLKDGRETCYGLVYRSKQNGVSRMEKINNYFRQLSLSALETMLERLFPGGTYPRD